MAYGDRTQVATDDFSTDPFTSRWTNGPADWNNCTWAGTDYVEASTANSDNSMQRSNSETFDDDQYSTVTLQNSMTASADDFVGPAVRSSTGAGDESAYIVYANSTNNRFDIYETNASFGFTLLANDTWPGAPSAGDTITAEAEGTTIRGGSNQGGGDTERVSTTDNTLTGGEPMIVFYDASTVNMAVDDWEGGDMGAVALSDVNYRATGRGIMRGTARGIG